MANTRITQGVIKPNEDYDVRHINATGIITAQNISIGGTLTYNDVTNVDSIGIVTAREGVFIPDSKELKIGNTAGSPDFTISHNTSNTLLDNNTGNFQITNFANDKD